MELEDQRVLVTGATAGIGQETAKLFARRGASVVITGRDTGRGAQTVAAIEAEGGRADFIAADLNDLESVRGLAERAGEVDVLVNNAANDARHTVEAVTPEYWDQSMAVNLKHQFFASQAVIPAMKKAGRGSIINMSSISWMIPSVGLPVYITAKAAIVGLTRTLAHELGASNIRVNCVLPGAIFTERQKQLWFTEAYKAEILSRQALKRLISPDEVARLVLFLAADDSGAITNQSYVIDGGWV